MQSLCDISESEYKKRITNAQKLLEKENLDALLVSSCLNAYYFTGLDSLLVDPSGVEQDMIWSLIIRRDAEPTFILPDFQKKGIVASSWLTDIRTFGTIWEGPAAIGRTWKELKLDGARVGAELSHAQTMHNGTFLDLARRSKFVDATELISKIRLVKSKEEANRIRLAAKIANRAFERAIPKIKEGMTERELAGMLGAYMYEEGADKPYYSTIRAGQKYLDRLYIARPSDYKLRRGDWMLLEWSAEYHHYVNEAKSILLLGAQPTQEQRELYDVYVEVLKKGIDKCRPGVSCAEVFQAEKSVFEEAGLDVGDPFRMGHGTGLEAHEPPDIRPQDKTVLQPEMAFAIEPWGVANAKGTSFGLSNTVVITSGKADRLPPLMNEIVCI
jgi:Xaa-Pro aminopeptidase